MHTFVETGPGVPAFLAKLWRLVEDSSTDNLISWSPDGKSFFIHNQAQFARELLPLNYKHNNMASFIRQLNMYGFHKITSIDNGGLKFDREDMEFSHAYFQRGHPHLLEHIKRKIAHPKIPEDKGLIKTETVNKVLTEVSSKVKMMRGRQDTLDTRFSEMKQENEALWREIAVLRQKHMKQQQIVNKLIQFLVTIVQPQRTGLSGMSGKRRYQLMINDAPQSSKMQRTNNDNDTGPIIHELGEELLDDVCEDEAELINTITPNIQSPITSSNIYNATANIRGEEDYTLEDAINSNENYFTTGAAATDQLVDDLPLEENNTKYNIHYMNELNNELNSFDDTETILTTPMVKQEMERTQNLMKRNQEYHENNLQQSQQQQQQRQSSTSSSLKLGKSLLKKHQSSKKNNLNLRKSNRNNTINVNNNNSIGKKFDSDEKLIQQFSGKRIEQQLQQQQPKFIGQQLQNITIDNDNDDGGGGGNGNNIVSNIKMEKLPMYKNQEDFMSAEMPNELFDDETLNDHLPDPMIGGITLEGDLLNRNNIKSKSNNKNGESSKTISPATNPSLKNEWALSKVPKNDEIYKLNSAADVGQHLENFQGELDSLKDLLRGEGISVNHNNLLGEHQTGNSGNKTPKILPSTIDIEQYLKLFADSDILTPFGITMSEKKTNDDQLINSYGSELMAYQPPINCDLSELLDDDSIPNDCSMDFENQNNPQSVLNTPMHVKDFQPFKSV